MSSVSHTRVNFFQTSANFVFDPSLNFKRVKNLALFIPKLGSTAILEVSGTAIGIIATIFSVFTVGKWKKCNNYATMTENSSNVLPEIFMAAIKILNPNFNLTVSECKHYGYHNNGKGLTRTKVSQILNNKSRKLKKNKSFFKKYIFLRIIFGLAIIATVITRIADLILFGLIGTILAFITFGTIKKINIFAINNLTFLGCIRDVCITIRYFVNPYQKSKMLDLDEDQKKLDEDPYWSPPFQQKILSVFYKLHCEVTV